jgi:tetratricopeptide (TPR) repeat protein
MKPEQVEHLQHHKSTSAQTPIHDPDADRTLLERWLRKQWAKGINYWLTVGIVAMAGLLALTWASRWLNRKDETAQRAWNTAYLTVSPDDLPKVAEAFGNSPGAAWLHYQAGLARYQEGMRNLPSNREAARPFLNQAFDEFKLAVDSASPADDYLKRLARLGQAHALEARNELPDAADIYEEVARSWPDSAEGKAAAARAALLRQPLARDFYEKFYAFKPPEFTLPARGSSSTTLPGSGSLLDLPPLQPEAEKKTPTPSSDLPANPFSRDEPARDKSTPPAGDLPDVFSKPGQPAAEPAAPATPPATPAAPPGPEAPRP